MENSTTILTAFALTGLLQVLMIYLAKWIFDIKERSNVQKTNTELLAAIAKKLGVSDSEVNTILQKHKN